MKYKMSVSGAHSASGVTRAPVYFWKRQIKRTRGAFFHLCEHTAPSVLLGRMHYPQAALFPLFFSHAPRDNNALHGIIMHY